MANYEKLLKSIYQKMDNSNLEFSSSPTYEGIKKVLSKGKTINISLKYQGAASGSHDYATAKANSKVSKAIQFNLEMKPLYSLAEIDNIDIEASKHEDGALVNLLKDGIEDNHLKMKQMHSAAIFKSGGGVIGQVSASSSTTNLLLSNISDIVNFSVGDKLQFADAWTSELTNSGAVLTVSKINRKLGSMTVDQNYDNVADDLDYIYREGSRSSSAETAGSTNFMMGLAGLIPAAAPSASEDFLGADRSVDGVKLAGNRVDGSTKGTLMASINELAADCDINGGDGLVSDKLIMSTLDFVSLQNELQSNGVSFEHKSEMKSFDGKVIVGIKAIEIMTVLGPVLVIADRYCPKGSAYLINFGQFEIHSLGSLVKFDSLKWVDGSDQSLIEAISYSNMCWSKKANPGGCGVIHSIA